jgi:phage/plasmid-associated DNA primase
LQDATNVYRSEQDFLEQWIAEKCAISPTASDTKNRLHSDYKNWCDAYGVGSLSRQRFSRKLTGKGYVMEPDKRTVIGIELIPKIWQQHQEEVTEKHVRVNEKMKEILSDWGDEGIDAYLDRELGVVDEGMRSCAK